MKNLKTFFATIALLLCCGSASAHDFEVDGIYYNITDSEKLTVAVTFQGDYADSYNDEYIGRVFIPQNVTYNSKNYSVTSIGNSAFYSCSYLTSVTIPNSVIRIDHYAFYSCGLISIIIGNSVSSIGTMAFGKCCDLTSVSIPTSVTSIGVRVFEDCSALASITIPPQCTGIGYLAFNNTAWYNNQPDGLVYAGKVAYKYKGTMPNNTSVEISEGILAISPYAFEDCRGLTSVTIPNSVKSIDYNAFDGCSNLTSITIPNSVKSIGAFAFDGTAWYKNQPDGLVYAGKVAYSFKGTMPSNTTIEITEGTLGISGWAFASCRGLTSVTIPNSVTCIGSYAFYDCRGLTSVAIPNSVASIDNDTFRDCSSLTSITIGNGVTNIGAEAFSGCNSLTSVTIPNSVTSIGAEAFSGCETLTSISLNTKKIDSWFQNIKSIKEVVLGDSVTSIGAGAFSGCSNLTSVTIPNSVKNIGDYAFYGCSILTSINIPDSVISIGESAFENCSSLTSVTIPYSVANIGENAFYGTAWYDNLPDGLLYVGKVVYKYKGTMPSNTSIELAEGTLEIVGGAFEDCNGLTSIIIPNSVISIGVRAFKGCNLTSISIPNSVTSIGNNAFESCNKLTSISLNTKKIDSWFQNIKSIKEVVLGDSVISIGENAFKYCNGLTSITIGNNVTTIGYGAFYGCGNLTSVHISDIAVWCKIEFEGKWSNPLESAQHLYINGKEITELIIPNGVTIVDDNAFCNCTSLTSVTIPSSVTSIGDESFSGCTNLTLVNIGSSVTSIGSFAFRNCTSLISVTIGANVTTIGYAAFHDCSNIKEVTSYIIEPIYIFDETFDFSNENFNAILYVPIESIEKYKATDGWKNFKTIIPINNGSSLALKVIDNKNNDITNDVNITWYDSDNTQIGTGKSLNGIEDSTTLYYSVQLNEDLGRIYREVDMRKIIVDADTIICQLEEIERITLEGRVSATDIDKTTITVNVKQMLNGKYEQTYITETNEQGTFKVEIFDDNTDITLSGDGYLDATLHRDGFNGNGSIGTIPLNLISGFAISANITQNKTIATGETKEAEVWSEGLNNIEFELYNVTKSYTLSNFTTQNGNIIIKTGAEVGDEIKLTAKSKQGIFADATTTFTIEDGANGFELVLTELGGIDVTYTSSSNSNTIGYLYDSDSKLVAKGSYVGEKLSLRHLQNGTYTLVSMGSSTLLGNLPNLANLREVGLNEGNDYVTTSVVVADGILAETTINEVPRMDDTRFYYTSSNTYFNANKESLTSGNYLTLSAHLDFKPEYSEKADVVNLSIEIPEGCQVVENSVIANRQAVVHAIDGNCLSMTLNKEQWQGQIRFCVIPLINKTYTLTAMASFDIDGSISQPIGTVQFEAKGLSLNTPKYAANKNIIINGTAIGHSEISIYDNDVLIGKTNSKADGSWTAECELFKPYSYSFHDIYAKITTGNGMELTSETRKVVYDKNMPVPQKVTMIHYNAEFDTNYNIVFDLINGDTNPLSYYYLPFEEWHGRTALFDFTFLADFTINDSTIIKNVNIKVLNSDGTVRTLPATFDGKQNCWVATTKYSSSSKLPMNVSVDYISIPEIKSDEEHKEAIQDLASSLITCANVMGDYFKDKSTMTLNSEEENAWSFNCLLDEAGLSFNYQIKDIDYTLAENMMKENQFVYFENENGVIGSYAEWTENQIIITGVDIEQKYAVQIMIDDSKDRARNSIRRAAGDLPVIVSGIGGKLLDIMGILEYVSVRTDMNNMFAQIKYYTDWYNSMRTDLYQLIMEKCRNDEFRLTPTLLKFAIIDINAISEMEDDFSKDYYEYIERYKRRLMASLMTDLVTFGIEKKIEAVFKGTKFIGSKANEWIAKHINSSMDTEKSARLISNSMGISLSAIENAGANSIFNYKDFQGTRDYIYSWSSEKHSEIQQKYIKLIEDIKRKQKKCEEDKETEEENNDEPNDNNDDFGIGATPIIDPSGYVYEAVLSNRLEGVTTTCYQKVQKEDMYGDVTEEVVKWNAADYSQQNPLKTDANGFYRWDVPQGMWQVKYEKEGYETVYSEWLPVPPPQLDVNVGMKQSTPPTVKQVRGYESGITIEMSKYMHPTTLNTTNVTITRNGMPVKGSIDILNLEKEPYGDAVFASKLKFIPETAFETTDEVMLTVHKEVESYCGVNMLNDYIQKIKIEHEIKEIVADSLISVPYQGTKEIQVVVLPKTASAGKTLRIQSSSSMITAINTEEIVLDENGSATLTLNGELPGSAFLTFTIDETDISKQSKVKVVTKYDMVAAPLASIKSGESVDAGTLLTLTCETEGATIYYTLDGSCPCDEAKRIKYEAPIAINSDVIVKAIAVREDMDDSDIATFVYMINATGIENIDMSGIKIWPYVTSSSIHIDLNDLKAENISVVNLDGATIYSAANVKGMITIDLGRYADGMYIVNVKCKDGKIVRKIIKINNH